MEHACPVMIPKAKYLPRLLSCILISRLIAEQATGYQIAWGAYYESSGSDLEYSIIFDTQSNLQITNTFQANTSLGASFHNQYDCGIFFTEAFTKDSLLNNNPIDATFSLRGKTRIGLDANLSTTDPRRLFFVNEI